MNRKWEHFHRSEYKKSSLDEADCPVNPMELLDEWIRHSAGKKYMDLPMVLSTVGHNNRPSSRVVLLRGFDGTSLHFFTNYNSRKGRNLALNPFAAINFYWETLERQVRLEGRVEKNSAADSDKYFASRPLGSKISAIISPQSEVIPNRNFLEQRHNEFMEMEKSGSKRITRPDFWGGFIFYPDMIEFWQGRPGRLHDRIEYRLEEGEWKMRRLGP